LFRLIVEIENLQAGRRHEMMLGGVTMSVLSYFRSPFPSTEGFSAYRMPGVAVHGPLIFASVFVGFFLCWPHPMLRPLLTIWVLGGIYLGRDIMTCLPKTQPLKTGVLP
jgi:hypothetical protein